MLSLPHVTPDPGTLWQRRGIIKCQNSAAHCYPMPWEVLIILNYKDTVLMIPNNRSQSAPQFNAISSSQTHRHPAFKSPHRRSAFRPRQYQQAGRKTDPVQIPIYPQYDISPIRSSFYMLVWVATVS